VTIFICLIVFAGLCYGVRAIDNRIVIEEAIPHPIILDSNSIYTDETPHEEPTKDMSDSQQIESSVEDINSKWNTLLDINKDIMGFITVPGTTIAYPVMQTKNNTDYLTLDFMGNYSVFGTPFLDYRVDLVKKSKNIVLYGHSVNGDELMGQFHRYLVQEFYDSNKVFTFNTLYEDSSYEIIAVSILETVGENLIDYTKTSFFHPDMLMEYVDTMVAKSSINTTSSYSSDDYFLTIQTCSKLAEDSKLVILAKQVT